MPKKKAPVKKVKEKREPFTLSTYTASGAKVLIKRYEAMGYKRMKDSYDDKKQKYFITFK